MANKSADVQREMMNNVEDLQFFLRDLHQWENQIKKKDEELLKKNNENEQKLKIGIRNSSDSSKTPSLTKTPKPEKQSKGNPSISKKLSSYDYAAWDKFDVDAECEKIDQEKSSSDVDTTDDPEDELELNRKRQQAILEKDKGNEFLKAEKIGKAIECYTKGATLDPENAIILANRALAFIKNKQFAAAEKDCDDALLIDKTYVKIYQRRAACREALRKYDQALEDLKIVLQYEPHNKESLNNLQKLKKIVEKNQTNLKKNENSKQPVAEQVVLDPRGEIVLPINKPAHLRSTKPLRRITITTVSDDVTRPKTSKMPRIESTITASTPTLVKQIPALPNSPSSFFRFQTDFTKLKSYQELQYQYFKNIPCTRYASLFRENLEPNTLSEVIELFAKYYVQNNDELLEPLKQLALTKRFSTMKLFFSQTDKNYLKQIFDHLRSGGNYEDFEIDYLVEAYGMAVKKE